MDVKHWLGNNNKAIGPLRVSGYGQEHNTSRITQSKDIEKYCKENGLELTEIIPIVETARRSDLRKKYQAIIKKALKEKVRHIIFHKYDREARNLTDNETNEFLVRENKIVLHYVSDGIVLHKESPDSEFLNRDIHAAINKHYSRDLSTKVRKATRTKAEMGWYPGTHTPLGYVHQKQKNDMGLEKRRGTIVVFDPDPRIVEQVKREFELRVQRDDLGNPMPLYKIRREIISEGFIKPSEIKHYHIATIERRLKNIFYDARFNWQGIEYKGNHERIVSKELFWEAQETFGLKNPYQKRSDALFSGGWLKCSCGCSIIFDPKTKTILGTGETKTYRYYHCSNGKKEHLSLKGLQVTEENLFEQFAPAVKQITIREDFRDMMLTALNESNATAKRARKKDLESYRLALKKLEGLEDQIYEDYRAGVLDGAGYKRQFQKVREDRAHFTTLMEEAQEAINDVRDETSKTILELATNADSLWNLMSAPEKRVFLSKLLSNQVLDGVTVRYELIKPLRTLSEMTSDSNWRRGRDSNSRDARASAGFQDRCFQPLSHLSYMILGGNQPIIYGD